MKNTNGMDTNIYQLNQPLENYWKWNNEALSLIEQLKNCPQSAIHHAEGDVYTHTQMVLAQVMQLLPEEAKQQEKILMLTAILHDIAKPMTTIWENDDWRSPRHAKIGEDVARKLLWNQLNFEERETVAALVRHHGLPIWFNEKYNPEKAVIEASLRCNLKDLAFFAECDFRGRICQDLDENLFKIDLFREKAFELDCLEKPYAFRSDWARLHYFKKEGYPGVEIWEPEGPWLVMMCGIAGSGKNTWIEKNWDGKIVELDAIRKRLKIKPTDKEAQGTVIQAAREEMKEALRKKENVLWNATNLTVQHRTSVIDIALQYKAKIKIVYIDCSLEKALSQNRNRAQEKQVPENVIGKMFKKLQIPTQTEAHVVEIINDTFT